MNSIYLQYGTYTNGVITWSSSKQFTPSKVYPIIETKRQKGYDLRDVPFNSQISSRENGIKVTINPRDLFDSSSFNFIKDFYKADAWRYNYTDANWDTNSVRVELEEQGSLPIEYIDNNKYLKVITLTLKQWFPNG